jgi:hypothetical protein
MNLLEKMELFFDKNIILNKSNNIIYKLNKPIFKKCVLNVDQEYEGGCNNYHTIIKNNNYKLYYRAVKHDLWDDYENKIINKNARLGKDEEFSIAESDDGLIFNKKKCLTHLKENNFLKKENFCHNFYPYFNKNLNNYLGISGINKKNNGLFLFNSKDGIIWNKKNLVLNQTHILPGFNHLNHFDSHNSLFYNNYDNYYYIYLRDNQHKPFERRFVQYTKSKDLINFEKCKSIHILNKNIEQLHFYVFNAFLYNNYFIAIPTISSSIPTEKNSNMLLYSLDGENWNILNENFFNINNNNYCIVSNIVESLDNNELYFYLNLNSGFKNHHIDCYSIKKDRFCEINCKEDGYIETKLIELNNETIYVNFETFNNGWLEIDIIDKNKKQILKSKKLNGNKIYEKIIWDISNIIFKKDKYYLKFTLFNSSLFSFKYY